MAEKEQTPPEEKIEPSLAEAFFRMECESLLEKELNEDELLHEIDEALSRARIASWIRFWKAGAGTKYIKLARDLIKQYGKRKYKEGYSEGCKR